MNLPENYDVKEINMGNISHIIYYENNLVSQDLILMALLTKGVSLQGQLRLYKKFINISINTRCLKS